MSPAEAGRFDLAANVSMLFTEAPLDERFTAAASAGFQAAEAWWPFPDSADPGASAIDELVGAVLDSGIQLTGLNFFAGDMPGGERGIVSHPGRQDEFAANIEVMLGIARRTGLAGCNALYGQRLPGVSAGEQDLVALDNLSAATRAMADAGVTVLVEPLATGLNGEYPLLTAEQVAAVVTRVRENTGLDNIGFLFDTFHLASNGEDLLSVIDRHAELIAHVQLADAPGRGEPGTGALDFEVVLGRLQARGYDGVVACEYKPTGTTADSFGWLGHTTLIALDS